MNESNCKYAIRHVLALNRTVWLAKWYNLQNTVTLTEQMCLKTWNLKSGNPHLHSNPISLSLKILITWYGSRSHIYKKDGRAGLQSLSLQLGCWLHCLLNELRMSSHQNHMCLTCKVLCLKLMEAHLDTTGNKLALVEWLLQHKARARWVSLQCPETVPPPPPPPTWHPLTLRTMWNMTRPVATQLLHSSLPSHVMVPAKHWRVAPRTN